MLCSCSVTWTSEGKDAAHYKMLLNMRRKRAEAAKLAATPGCFNAARKEAKEFEEIEYTLMDCLKKSGNVI